jgi:hypothetical protein
MGTLSSILNCPKAMHGYGTPGLGELFPGDINSLFRRTPDACSEASKFGIQ